MATIKKVSKTLVGVIAQLSTIDLKDLNDLDSLGNWDSKADLQEALDAQVSELIEIQELIYHNI